jgi:serine/threonine protein kinase
MADGDILAHLRMVVSSASQLIGRPTGSLMITHFSPQGWFAGPDDEPDALRLVSLLGGGGESDVWMARTATTAESGFEGPVALKIFHPDGPLKSRDGEWLERFNLIKEINAPGFAKVYETFLGQGPHSSGESLPDEPSRRYLVMEYVDGVTLADWVLDHPEASYSERITILRTLAHGVDALNQGRAAPQAMAHGDINPQNIRISSDREVKLVDYGQAVALPSATPAAMTFPFGAPELYKGEPATVFSDRYAFAATTFFVLTGSLLPYSRSSTDQANHEHAYSLLQQHQVTRRRPRLTTLIMRGLNSSPGQRPPCREIADCPDVSQLSSDEHDATGRKHANSHARAVVSAMESYTFGGTAAPLPPLPSAAPPPPPPGAAPPPFRATSFPPLEAAVPPLQAALPPFGVKGQVANRRKRRKTQAAEAGASAEGSYFSSLWTMSDIAAPLLATAAITFLSVALSGDPRSSQHDWALILFVSTAGSMIMSLQCGFYAKLYVGLANSRSDAQNNSRARIWTNRARRSYSFGILLLWLGIAVALLPGPAQQSLAWVPSGIAGFMALLEFAWIMAPLFG